MRARHVIAAPALLLVIIAVMVPIPSGAVTTQYVPLASYDFLSPDEVTGFSNVTADGLSWDQLTQYSVSNGVLNITNDADVDAFLVLPQELGGYAEVTLTQGVIAILTNYNRTATSGTTTPTAAEPLMGYEVVKTASGIAVYSINGTSKTAVASSTTTSDTVAVGVVNGQFYVALPGGNTVYTAPLDRGVLALGALANDTAAIDKVVLYGITLAGQYEIDLGTATLTASSRVASFSYDLSDYDIQSAKLVLELSGDDLYLREWAVDDQPIPDRWWTDSNYQPIASGKSYAMGTLTVDLTSTVQGAKTGTIYFAASVGGDYKWDVHAKLVIDGSSGSGSGDTSQPPTTTTTSGFGEYLSNPYVKYALIGAGALLVLFLVVPMVLGNKGKKGVVGLATAFIVLLIFGGIAIAVLAWLHPEWLTALAMGLGALAILTLVLLSNSPKQIPNPTK